MTADTWTNLINGATLVYDGTQTFNTTGWFPLNLTTPFNYLSGNLMVLCEANYGGTGTSPYPYFNYTTTTATGSHQYQYADNSPSTAVLTLNTSRPNIKMSGMIAGCSSPRVPAIVNVGPQSPLDAGVIEITTPNTGVNLTNSQIVTVEVKNFGSTPISNFNMKYKVDNNVVVTQLITDTIQPNTFISKSFTQTVDLSSSTQPQTFVIKAWTGLTGDATALNDTTTKVVKNMPPTYCICSATSTAYEDLVNVTLGTINNTSQPVGAMYTDFTTTVPPTNLQPGMTYPISVSSNYAAGYSYQYTCWLNVFIDFNRDGVFDTTAASGERAFSITTTSFNTVTGNITVPFISTPGLTRMRVVFRESGTIDNTGPCNTYTWGETEDYTVNIIPPIPHDAGIAKMNNLGIYLPFNAPLAQQPQFFIRNYGSDTLGSATIAVNLNGNIDSIPWSKTPALLSLQMDSIIHNLTLQNGLNRIKAYTILNGDVNYMNDTLTAKVFKEYLASPPYFDNFENNEFFFASDTAENGYAINNLWRQGVPNPNIVTNVPSPTKVWATNLDTNYTANNISYLYSPIFLITPMQADTLKFKQFRQMSTGATATLEYKTGGSAWVPLGVVNDPNATNWFNDTNKYWKNSTTGWIQSTYKLSNLTNLGATVQFRFVFKTANATPLQYGWAIDDFSVTLLPIPNDAGVISILTPGTTSSVGDSVTVKVTVKNFGTSPLTNIPVMYKATPGSNVVSGTVPGPLAPDATIDYTFTQKFGVGTQNYTICAYTQVTGDIYTLNDTSCKNVSVIPALNDVGVVEIIYPTGYVLPGATYHPKIAIKNFGSTSKTSIPVSFQRGTSTPVSENWSSTSPLNLGDTVHYTFAGTFNAPSAGTSFYLSAYTSLTGDAYSPNDKISSQLFICNIGAPLSITGNNNPDFGQTGVSYVADSVVGATTYTWTYSGTNVTINGNGTRFVTLDFGNNATNGQLSVIASNANCQSTPTTFNIAVSVNDIFGENFWLGQNVPNPTTGLTNIAYGLPSAGKVKFNIMNLYGQTVYTFSNEVDSGKHLINLDINNLAAGVYYYTIEFKGKRLIKKMVINK